MKTFTLIPILAAISLAGCADHYFEETHIVKCSYGEWWHQCEAKAEKLCEGYRIKDRYGAYYKDGELTRRGDDFTRVRTMAVVCPADLEEM